MAKKNWFGRAGVWILTRLTRLLYRPRVRRVCTATEEAVIYYSNHVSVIDAPVLYQALGEGRVCGLAAKDWYEKPLLTPIFRAADVIPVNRYGLDTNWLRLCVTKLQEGKSILLFPEGHVRKDGVIDPFQAGILMLARRAAAKLVPVWHPKYRAFRKTPVIIGEPISPPTERLRADEQEQACAELRERLLDLKQDA